MGYLIPANSKKSMLIFGAFTGFDLGLPEWSSHFPYSFQLKS